jgi:hypothetical protein
MYILRVLIQYPVDTDTHISAYLQHIGEHSAFLKYKLNY